MHSYRIKHFNFSTKKNSSNVTLASCLQDLWLTFALYLIYLDKGKINVAFIRENSLSLMLQTDTFSH